MNSVFSQIIAVHVYVLHSVCFVPCLYIVIGWYFRKCFRLERGCFNVNKQKVISQNALNDNH